MAEGVAGAQRRRAGKFIALAPNPNSFIRWGKNHEEVDRHLASILQGGEEVPIREVELFITLCDNAAESLATFAIKAQSMDWPLTDPVLAEGDDEQVLQV